MQKLTRWQIKYLIRDEMDSLLIGNSERENVHVEGITDIILDLQDKVCTHRVKHRGGYFHRLAVNRIQKFVAAELENEGKMLTILQAA